MNRDDYKAISRFIVQAFPTEEEEIYFDLVPRSNPRGKLVTSMRNYRSRLIKSGLVQGKNLTASVQGQICFLEENGNYLNNINALF